MIVNNHISLWISGLWVLLWVIVDTECMRLTRIWKKDVVCWISRVSVSIIEYATVVVVVLLWYTDREMLKNQLVWVAIELANDLQS